MARKPENQYITGVHAHLDPSVYRMKTHNPYVAGVPDCYYSGSGGDLWVEYKFVPKLPVKVPVDIDLSALQRRWIECRHEEGRAVRVIVGSPEGGIVLSAPELTEVFSASEFRIRMLSKKEIAEVIESITLKGR